MHVTPDYLLLFWSCHWWGTHLVFFELWEVEPVEPPVGEASSEQQEGASQMPDWAVIIVSNVEIYKLYRVNTKKSNCKDIFLYFSGVSVQRFLMSVDNLSQTEQKILPISPFFGPLVCCMYFFFYNFPDHRIHTDGRVLLCTTIYKIIKCPILEYESGICSLYLANASHMYIHNS